MFMFVGFPSDATVANSDEKIVILQQPQQKQNNMSVHLLQGE